MAHLGVIFLLAWRNLWRNHRRTAIMLMAVVLGAWAMIFMTALMRGMVNDMIRDGIDALPGHVQVHHPGYRDDPSVENLVTLTAAELEAGFAELGIERVSARVRVPAVISSERESRGVTLIGADPAAEARLGAIGSDIVEGTNLDGPGDPGIVIGQRLADKLETRVGKRVVIMSQDPDNDVADRGFRVVGLYRGKLAAQEELFAIGGRETIQQMLRIDDRVSEVALLSDDYRDVTRELEAAKRVAGDGNEVLPWEALDRFLSTMMGVMDGFVLVWIVVIFLALSFGFVNTLVMAVFERVREIGLMLALGMQPSSILGQIVIESLLMLAIGLLAGNVLAVASIAPISDGIDVSIVGEGMEMFGYSTMLYPSLELQDVVLANVVVLVLGFLASLSPAWRASRYKPVEAITKV